MHTHAYIDTSASIWDPTALKNKQQQNTTCDPYLIT